MKKLKNSIILVGHPSFENSAIIMAIRINLHVVMAKQRMSLNELSERVGIPITSLSPLKNGRTIGIKWSTLNLLCNALQCEPADLIEYIPDIPPPGNQ